MLTLALVQGGLLVLPGGAAAEVEFVQPIGAVDGRDFVGGIVGVLPHGGPTDHILAAGPRPLVHVAENHFRGPSLRETCGVRLTLIPHIKLEHSRSYHHWFCSFLPEEQALQIYEGVDTRSTHTAKSIDSKKSKNPTTTTHQSAHPRCLRAWLVGTAASSTPAGGRSRPPGSLAGTPAPLPHPSQGAGGKARRPPGTLRPIPAGTRPRAAATTM